MRELESLEAQIASWQSDAAAAAAQLQSALASRAGALPGGAQRLASLLAARSAWLDGAGRVAAGVCHVLEAAVQLEASRRGRLWEPGAAAGEFCQLLLLLHCVVPRLSAVFASPQTSHASPQTSHFAPSLQYYMNLFTPHPRPPPNCRLRR